MVHQCEELAPEYAKAFGPNTWHANLQKLVSVLEYALVAPKLLIRKWEKYVQLCFDIHFW